MNDIAATKNLPVRPITTSGPNATSGNEHAGAAAARARAGIHKGVDIARMIRVDQAGEYGATRIYAGQLAVMGDRAPHSAEITAMAREEDRHNAEFNALMTRRGVRPTILQPFWSAAGYTLGAVTALLGPEAAMACTAAVEEEIDRHYSDQLDELEMHGVGTDSADPELSGMIEDFREDERQHRDTALAHGAEKALGYPLLSGAIRLGCRAAIRLAERI